MKIFLSIIITIFMLGNPAYASNLLINPDNAKTISIEQLQEQDLDKINNKDDSGATALLYASSQTHEPRLIEFLIKHGADVNARDNYAMTALMVASSFNNNPNITKALLKHGANVQAIDNSGNTALNMAIRNGTNLDIIKILIKAGSNVNHLNHIGNIPIMLALNNQQSLAVVKYLIDHGADLGRKDKYQHNALMLALLNIGNPKRYDIIKAILNHNIKPEQMTLDYIRTHEKDQRVVRLIESYK